MATTDESVFWELIDDGVGEPFAPAGTVFKEWVSVPEHDP